MTESTHSIRYVLKEDMEQLIELCRQHAAFEQAEYDATNKSELLSERLFSKSALLKCIVVELEGDLIGYATFMKHYSTWDASNYVYMDCLFLNIDARNRRIGQELMEEIKSYAIAEDCQLIQWQTPKDNRDAIRFYHRLGATSKTKERFFLNLTD